MHVLFEACPTREITQVPCPNFGATGDCDSCMFAWDSLAITLYDACVELEKRRSKHRRLALAASRHAKAAVEQDNPSKEVLAELNKKPDGEDGS